MALTEIPIELSSTPGIVDNSNATAITIDSSENVGIGVTPSSQLEVQDANGVSLKFGDLASYPNNVVPCFIGTGTSALAGVNGDLVLCPRTSDAGKIIFATGNGQAAERMRVDASGNFLVGKTTTTFGTAGLRFAPTGAIDATVSGDGSLFLNRLSDQGPLAYFYQASVNRGIIGTVANDLFIASVDSGHNGLRFHADGILPTNNAGAIVDADANLGDPSYRFKDLYLSGGAYLGGTGSANYLEDYEEGTFTPTITAATGSLTTVSATGNYTKVGRLVTFAIDITVTNNGTGGGNLRSTLPFTASGINQYGAGRETVQTGFALTGTITGTVAVLVKSSDDTYPATSGDRLQFSGTYIV